jgi:TRAP transporter TAXI family solute receptor
MGDVAYFAYKGEGKFDSRMGILALAVMYPNVLQVVTKKNSGVEDFGQLKGKTVSIGAPGSGTAFMSDLMLQSLGLGKDEFEVARLSFSESTMALKDGTIDVGIWSVAAPTSSIMDLATTHDVRILSLNADEQKKILDQYPFYAAYELPADTYRGMEAPVPTISVWNVIICKSDLPADLIYQLVKVLFESNEYMKKIHPMARFTTPENTVKHSPIPLHPGAVRYLKEKGLEVPAELMPKH